MKRSLAENFSAEHVAAPALLDDAVGTAGSDFCILASGDRYLEHRRGDRIGIGKRPRDWRAALSASALGLVSAAAITTAATAASATAAAGSVLARLGFINGQSATVMLLTVERPDGRLGGLFRVHLYEPESLTASGLAVADDLSALHGSVRRKQLLQLRAVHVVR